MTTAEYPLPAQQHAGAARKAEGFATPKQDKKPQCARILPKRVVPIIFLPGIMGSNLRLSEKRQRELGREDNIAWRPDSLWLGNITRNANSPSRERQLRLDPLETTVDIYDPTGPSDVSGDKRHANVELQGNFASPSLANDIPPGTRTAVQKARLRGWGEVYFKSYGFLLQYLEARLNGAFFEGKLCVKWGDVVGIDPHVWSADPGLPQQALTEDELKKVVSGCWFPVYAFGYNWLQSNGDSAKIIAKRINKLMSDLDHLGYECKKVIVVTHSMGGLVGRALVHPAIGAMQDKVLGLVHGVMPSIGAPAAYKRMKAGFEDPGLIHGVEDSIGAKVAGNFGDEVTAVLANAPGGLELLPSDSYGNGWLRVTHKGRELETWPKSGDPYKEIYKVRNKWYALLREDWINPSHSTGKDGGASFERTCRYLDRAQRFHQRIANTFHPNTYAHYGADAERRSFGEVVWEIDENCIDPVGWKDWPVISDTRQGTVELVRSDAPADRHLIPSSPMPQAGFIEMAKSIHARILPPASPGDQTVPVKSADHQIQSGILQGVFRQTGYEHQSSYKDPRAIASTLYSIIRLAQKAEWHS